MLLLESNIWRVPQCKSSRSSEDKRLQHAALRCVSCKLFFLETQNSASQNFLQLQVIVEACIKNSTHYIDVTGELPWMSLGMTIENSRINWKTASDFTSAFGQGMTWSRNIMLKLGSKDQWSYSPPGMCVPRPSGKHHHYPDIGWFPGDSWCLSKVRLMIFFATAWWKSWAPWKCTVPGTIFGPSCRIGQFFMDLTNPKIQKKRFQWIVSGRSSLRWIFLPVWRNEWWHTTIAGQILSQIMSEAGSVGKEGPLAWHVCYILCIILYWHFLSPPQIAALCSEESQICSKDPFCLGGRRNSNDRPRDGANTQRSLSVLKKTTPAQYS